jgi:hypothetical protein
MVQSKILMEGMARPGREACPTECYHPLLWSKSVLPQYYALQGWDA